MLKFASRKIQFQKKKRHWTVVIVAIEINKYKYQLKTLFWDNNLRHPFFFHGALTKKNVLSL